MNKLENKVALITGGTNGMGFATAREFISQGAKVIITGRNLTAMENALLALGTNAYGLISDAGSMADLMEISKEVKKITDRIDVLFVNAGYGKFSSIEETDEVFYDNLFNVITKGTFFTVQQVLPLMPPGSSIILNTSVVTTAGMQNFSIYTAAKAAVQSFIKTFAAECTAKGIRVNGISPGYISTNIFNNTGLTPQQIEGTIDTITPTLPFKRFGTSEEIAKTAMFLASDDSSYIHGAEIPVDGGLSAIN